MKILNICLFFLLFTHSPKDIKFIRNLYIKAVSDKAACEALLIKIKAADKDTPVLLGYKGASYMIMAKHEAAPWNKWQNFKKGRQLLEDAISLQPEEPELRFLRLAIQSKLPGFLNYSSEIQTDQLFLKRKISSIQDEDLQKKILSLLTDSAVIK